MPNVAFVLAGGLINSGINAFIMVLTISSYIECIMFLLEEIP